MKELSEKTIEALCAHLKAIAKAADLATDENTSIDSLYEAIDECMALDAGVVSMTGVYDSILFAAAHKTKKTPRQ